VSSRAIWLEAPVVATHRPSAPKISTRTCPGREALSSQKTGPLAGFGLEIGWATFPHEGVTAQEVVALARRRCVSIATPIPAAS
jgi:hypothetical protein